MIRVQTLPHWLQSLALWMRRPPAVAAAGRHACPTPKTTLAAFQTLEMETDGVVTVVVQVHGPLDHHTFLDFIAVAETLYRGGARRMVIDLKRVTALELSGLFALHSIAHLYAGEGLLDPEYGWATLRRLANEPAAVLPRPIKLVCPSTVAAAAIKRASFCHCFATYATLDAALAAFEPVLA